MLKVIRIHWGFFRSLSQLGNPLIFRQLWDRLSLLSPHIPLSEQDKSQDGSSSAICLGPSMEGTTRCCLLLNSVFTGLIRTWQFVVNVFCLTNLLCSAGKICICSRSFLSKETSKREFAHHIHSTFAAHTFISFPCNKNVFPFPACRESIWIISHPQGCYQWKAGFFNLGKMLNHNHKRVVDITFVPFSACPFGLGFSHYNDSQASVLAFQFPWRSEETNESRESTLFPYPFQSAAHQRDRSCFQTTKSICSVIQTARENVLCFAFCKSKGKTKHDWTSSLAQSQCCDWKAIFPADFCVGRMSFLLASCKPRGRKSRPPFPHCLDKPLQRLFWLQGWELTISLPKHSHLIRSIAVPCLRLPRDPRGRPRSASLDPWPHCRPSRCQGMDPQ